MKKTYISPVVTETILTGNQIIAASITNIGGNSSLGFGDGDTPTSADTKEYRDWDIWGTNDDDFEE